MTRFGEARRRVDARADRGAAERQLADPRQHGQEPLDAVLDRLRVAAELLAERDRRGVHQVGAPGLHHRPEPALLAAQRLREVLERGDQIVDDLARRREMDRRREHVVRRLRGVHVVVRVHGRARAPPTPAGRSPRSCSCSTTCPSRSGTRRPGSGRRPTPRHLGGRVVDRHRHVLRDAPSADRSPSPRRP